MDENCSYCGLINSNTPLEQTEDAVVLNAPKKQSDHHLLVMPKKHIAIGKLTAKDIEMVDELNKTGRKHLRLILKQKGEPDIIEDHLLSIVRYHKNRDNDHISVEIVYPTTKIGFFAKMTKFKRRCEDVADFISHLRQKSGAPDPFENNPANEDDPEALPAHAIVN